MRLARHRRLSSQRIGLLRWLLLALLAAATVAMTRQIAEGVATRSGKRANLAERSILEFLVPPRFPEAEREPVKYEAFDIVDESSYESFPASDAPGWIRQHV